MKRMLIGLALIAAIGIILFIVPGTRRRLIELVDTTPSSTNSGEKILYQCSMHPQIITEQPGFCPICQMKLQRVESGGMPTPAAAQRKILFYRHPMRPDISSPVPAKDEMGMDYIPVYAEDIEDTGASVAGHAAFTLSPDRQQLIGVTKQQVESRNLEIDIRAAGKVAYDPALYQAIIDYQQAIKGRRGLKESQSPEALAGADAITRASYLRLRQLGLSDQQIQQNAATGRDPTNLLLPGKSVWVYVQVYEYEVELLHAGQHAVVVSPSMTGKSYDAQVIAIDPIVSASTRTARVRMTVSTPDADLRPETFVHARIHVPLGNQLAVPEDAILDTGEHQIAFVVTKDNRFEPRDVKLGRNAGGYYEVLSGLAEGEEVVTSANFLIDSESRVRAALKAFSRESTVSDGH